MTGIDTLLMVEQVITGGISHAINQYVEANKNTRKIMVKIKNNWISNILSERASLRSYMPIQWRFNKKL